jgi:hypothetical protein
MHRRRLHGFLLATAGSLLASLVGHATPALAGTCSVQASATASGAAVQIHATANCSAGVEAIRFLLDGIPITEVRGPDATVTWRSDDPASSHTIGVAAAEVGDTTWSHAAKTSLSLPLVAAPSTSTAEPLVAPIAAASNRSCRFDVRPGAWTHTGVKAKKGDSFSMTATGTLSRGAQQWGPNGYYLLGFMALNLHAKIDGGRVQDIGSSGSVYADVDGEVLLGTAVTYEPKPSDAKDIQGSFAVTLDSCTAPATVAPLPAPAPAPAVAPAPAPAPAPPPPPASASRPDPDQTLRDAFRGCPGSFDAYVLLRQMNADGRLVIDSSQSALADFSPRMSVLGGFIDKLGSATLGIDSTDHLGWLLTESATPRYPANPYVQLTRDRQQVGEGGEPTISLESNLANRIASSSGALQPNDILKLALQATNGDYPLAMLTAHNLLKELTYASRAPNGGVAALVGWAADDRGTDDDAINGSHAGYEVRSPAQVQALIGKLANLRGASDPLSADKMGPWYHVYGVLFVGSVTTGTEATSGAWFENITRWLKLGSRPDSTKEFINACAGQLARYIADLPRLTSE